MFNGELSTETVFGAHGKDRHALTHLDVYEIDDDTGLNWTANQAEDNQAVLDKYVDDYLIPCSSTDYLTRQKPSMAELGRMYACKKRIYARHGRIFKTAEIAAYFKSKDWYAGTIPSNVIRCK
ncbi:MAG: YARHG domain-containing protein [Oscillospiraceae bacterium]